MLLGTAQHLGGPCAGHLRMRHQRAGQSRPVGAGWLAPVASPHLAENQALCMIWAVLMFFSFCSYFTAEATEVQTAAGVRAPWPPLPCGHLGRSWCAATLVCGHVGTCHVPTGEHSGVPVALVSMRLLLARC